jgi:hypothetical protein
MAALILADELPLDGAVVVRGDAPPVLGETVTAAGFGVGETNASTRREVTNVRINRILDGAFTVGGGILCYGDSGGPAFSEDTGALVGVYSRKTGDCSAKETENRFVTVSTYKSVVEEALEQTNEEATWEEVASGGAPPVVEAPEEKETDPAEPPNNPEAPEDPSTTEESGDGDAFRCSTAPHSEPPLFSRLAWLLMGLLVFRRSSRRD